MAVTESSRHRLYKKLEEVLGMEEAETLFDLVPAVGWGDIATKQDLEESRLLTKRDLEELRSLTKRDLEELQSLTKRDLEEFQALTNRDFQELRSDFQELRRDLQELRIHTKKDLDLVESRLNNRLTDELTTRLRGLFFAIAALFIGVISLLLAVPHLL